MTIKKIRAATKGAVKKTKVIVKKASKAAVKEASKVAKTVQKNWRNSAPQRAIYKKEVEAAAKKAGAKGMEMLKSGLKHGIKIGSDVAEVVKKDIKEINEGK